MFESCDIYITGIEYKDSSWVDDPDELIQTLYDNFNEINEFYFINMALNMSQVYNVTLKDSNYDSSVLYLKGVRYKHKEFFDLDEVRLLENELREQMSYIEGLIFLQIEMRCTKKYTDYNLDLLELP